VSELGTTDIWTAEQLAKHWGVGKDWIYAKVREGELPNIPLPGKLVRFRLDVIEAFERGEIDARGRPRAAA
jgi:excisionase family DNA binding protein